MRNNILAGLPPTLEMTDRIIRMERDRADCEAQRNQMMARIDEARILEERAREMQNMPRIPNYDRNNTRFRRGRNTIRIAPPVSIMPMSDAIPSVADFINILTLTRDYDIATRANIIQLESDISTSWLGLYGLNAISLCLTDIADNRDENEPAISDYHINRISRSINELKGKVDLRQMAQDKVWPMFWYCIADARRESTSPTPIPYNRDNAKASIAEWREITGFSKKQWKWLCNKPHWYLFKLFIAPSPWDIRWPENILREREDMGQITTNRALQHYGFIDWLRDYFMRDEHCSINPLEFDYTMRDIIDICQQPRGPTHPETIRQLLTSENWQELTHNARAIEGHNPFSLEAGAVNFVRGDVGIDMARGRDISAIAFRGDFAHEPPKPIRPKEAKPIEVLSPYPKEIELGKHKAILLDDDQKLYDESDNLRHCIYRTYSPRIERGEYIAYHITGPGTGRNGATCGIRKHKQEPIRYRPHHSEILRSMRKIKNKISWQHDQTRGKGNSIPNMDKAIPFIDHVVKLCNEAMPDKIKNSC